jgi:hypothetical protein
MRPRDVWLANVRCKYAVEGEDLVDAGEEAGPAGAGGGAVRRVWQVGGADPGGICCGSQDGAAVSVARRHDRVAVEVDDPFSEAGVRSEDTMIAVAVDAPMYDLTEPEPIPDFDFDQSAGA